MASSFGLAHADRRSLSKMNITYADKVFLMLDYPALRALAEIIRRGSFEAAAHALAITPSAISQRIRGLEDRSGAVLIDRGPPVRGTEAGLRLAAHLDQVRLLESTLTGGFHPAQPPVIRIAMNADSLATWAMTPLTAAPGLIDLVIDDQDHALDLLRNGQVAAALTSDSRPITGCDSIPLGRMRYRATATPEFAERHFPDGPDAGSLSCAPALNFNSKDGLQDRWIRQMTGRRIAQPLQRIPSSQAFAEATRLGLGWGMNPEAMIAEDLTMGRLIDLAPERPLDVPLYWQIARISTDALEPLTRAIREAARISLRF
ncbi:LysR family transcriptional regulator, chromosome initiation inhibitor [Paracoccus saliphilus]|uniref:LysR family transcriptional regulator, chromosome initiation inhibitor n=2 Tax=Paracoccus saliphilus TaxID=405559 RepID=A0AA45W4B9_9RHOB|nr:LysR family transcriptional regulator, chromosome initiation inhibitor [Paracoccus saliphilus]